MPRLLTVLPLLVALGLAAGCTNSSPTPAKQTVPEVKGKATTTGTRKFGQPQ